MPTNKTQILITLTPDELKPLRREAADNEKIIEQLSSFKKRIAGTAETRRGNRKKMKPARTTDKQGSDITAKLTWGETRYEQRQGKKTPR